MYLRILRELNNLPAGPHDEKGELLGGIKSKIYRSLPLSIDEAIAFRDAYYPGEPLEELYREETTEAPITLDEAVKIVSNGMGWAAFYELREALLEHIRNTKVNFSMYDRAARFAMGYGLAVGRAIGVREERARRKERT